jgi:hypothetical protein
MVRRLVARYVWRVSPSQRRFSTSWDSSRTRIDGKRIMPTWATKSQSSGENWSAGSVGGAISAALAAIITFQNFPRNWIGNWPCGGKQLAVSGCVSIPEDLVLDHLTSADKATRAAQVISSKSYAVSHNIAVA